MRIRRFLPFLFAATTIFTNVVAAENIAHGIRVVVLDAGHGGNDPGAHYAGVYEKELTLKVALKLGALIEEQMPGVKVVYTRKTDKALSLVKAEDLQARANVANKAEGDLFISIHVNAARSTAARGVETLIMGESPKEQRYNENALFENNRDDLIDMSDERAAAIVRAYIQNLQFTYGEYSMAMARCMQNNYLKEGRHSRGIKPQLLRVLYATDMPGVLTEIGFLSNTQEAAYLKSEKGQNEIARSLFRAVKDYSAYVLGSRNGEGGGSQTETAPAANEKPEVQDAPKDSSVSEQTTPTMAESATPEPAKAESGRAESGKTKPTKAEQATSAPVRYAVQLLASKTVVSLNSAAFKSYRGKVKQYRSDGTYRYKYCVHECADRATAQGRLAQVRKVFPQAFVVGCQDGKIAK